MVRILVRAACVVLAVCCAGELAATPIYYLIDADKKPAPKTGAAASGGTFSGMGVEKAKFGPGGQITEKSTKIAPGGEITEKKTKFAPGK